MNDLDRFIDAVLRDMTAAAPPADLRQRVLDRVSRRGPVFGGRLAWGTALATAAVVLGFVFLGDDSPLVTPPASVASRPPAAAPVGPALPEKVAAGRLPAAPGTAPESVLAVARRRDAARLMAVPEAAALEAPSVETVQPLALPEPIPVDPLPTAAIALEELSIEALEVEPLDFEPLRTDSPPQKE